MSEQAIHFPKLEGMQSDIETLARETDMPVAVVHEIYTIEHAKLDQAARIKTYLPVLTRRRVKELLAARRSKESHFGPFFEDDVARDDRHR